VLGVSIANSCANTLFIDPCL